MEQPLPPGADNSQAEFSPAQIEENARKDIILKGPNAELHRLNSIVWAYMHPAKTKFSEQGITIPHFKHEYVAYPLSWDEVTTQLQKIKEELKGDAERDPKVIIYNLICQKGPAYRFTLTDKLVIQKGFLSLFEGNKEKCLDEALKLNRAHYKRAFSFCNWQELPVFAAQPLHCRVHGAASLAHQIEIERIGASLAVVEQRKKEVDEGLARMMGVPVEAINGSAQGPSIVYMALSNAGRRPARIGCPCVIL